MNLSWSNLPIEIMPKQRYIEIKFLKTAGSSTKKINYRTKIRRMFYDLGVGKELPVMSRTS